MKTAQTKEGGALTHILNQVQQEIEIIQDDFRALLQSIESSKQDIIAAVMNTIQYEGMEEDNRSMAEAQVAENINDALDSIGRSVRLVGRMGTVTRSAAEISRRAEKTWKEALMDLIRDTKWYRERFPAAYEERKRKKEYERYRQRPELYHARPWAGEQGTKGPDLEGVRPRAANTVVLMKEAQLESLTVAVGELVSRLLRMIQTYFTADSPILQASNKIVGNIKKRMSKKFNEAITRGLKDQLQVLENLFGFEKQPGRYIVSGARAFLIPAAKGLQNALEILQNPLKDVQEVQSFTEEFGKRFEQPAAGSPVAPGEALTSQKKRILERFSMVTERQKRCSVIQRIASSR